jgi:hypothetical protein
MGNKVGITVGMMPNLNSPPINPFLLLYNILHAVGLIDDVFGLGDNFLTDLCELDGFFGRSKI